ncbi:MAG TPA: winged helix-turn-helix domain-containing protein [Arenimonas sp.]|nr:winged helix-turn-helix domain-containing protein [Arenimonas sp.]
MNIESGFEPPVNDPAASAGWTFMSNHTHVLVALASVPGATLREVAAKVGITERAVQRIVAELEGAGALVREREGRRNLYRIQHDLRLRHPLEAHRTIGELLELVLSGA